VAARRCRAPACADRSRRRTSPHRPPAAHRDRGTSRQEAIFAVARGLRVGRDDRDVALDEIGPVLDRPRIFRTTNTTTGMVRARSRRFESGAAESARTSPDFATASTSGQTASVTTSASRPSITAAGLAARGGMRLLDGDRPAVLGNLFFEKASLISRSSSRVGSYRERSAAIGPESAAASAPLHRRRPGRWRQARRTSGAEEGAWMSRVGADSRKMANTHGRAMVAW